MTTTHKIIKGTVTIDGTIYTAFEMFDGGPWKVMQGTRYDDPVVSRAYYVKSGNKALEAWLTDRTEG